MNRYLLALLALVLANVSCGPDGCDPTGAFGCSQYTKHVSITLDNQSSEDVAAAFKPCECCSEGRAKWTVPAKSTVTKEIKVVDEGGGDACDESAAYWRITYKSAKLGTQASYFTDEQRTIKSTCTDEKCDLGVKPPH